jgi:hypothetical protein
MLVTSSILLCNISGAAAWSDVQAALTTTLQDIFSDPGLTVTFFPS